MFGERYFATRARLAGVMHGIARLAGETATDLDGRLDLDDLNNGLGSPFLFVVCGEVNAGKSTFINGLFGHDLCKVSKLPETSRVLTYQYGSPSRDVEITPLLEERHRPIPFLRDFTLIDTPGTDSAVQGHAEISARFMPAAEVIFFVFPVTNPWGAATWNAISKLSAESLQRIVLIVQQADTREEADLRVILGHMADLSLKRLGRVPPLFAVSGKLAWESQKSVPINAAVMRESGYLELQKFLSERICDSPARRESLENWRRQAASALRAVEDQLEGQTRALSMQSQFLDSIEREIGDIRERFVIRLPSHLAGVAEVFETEAIWASKLLHRRLSAISSLFRLFTGDRTGPQMEAVFIARLQGAVEAIADKDGVEVVEVCRSHWNELRERVKAAMKVDLERSDHLDPTLEHAKNRFVQRLGRSARQGIGNLKVRNQLDKDLRRRNVALKSFTFMTLLLTTVGGVCGAMKIAWLPEISCGLAAVFLAGGVSTAWVTRKAITAEFRSRLLDTCGTFASTLRSDYEDALRIVFEDYASSLTIVRTHLAHAKLAAEPRTRRWQDLFLTLKAIEQDL